MRRVRAHIRPAIDLALCRSQSAQGPFKKSARSSVRSIAHLNTEDTGEDAGLRDMCLDLTSFEQRDCPLLRTTPRKAQVNLHRWRQSEQDQAVTVRFPIVHPRRARGLSFLQQDCLERVRAHLWSLDSTSDVGIVQYSSAWAMLQK